MQGNAGARVKVGDHMFYGRGIAQSEALAAQEYRAAADGGSAQVCVCV